MGSDTLPTFSVTAKMREEPHVVQRFVDFYRAAGAERIYIYFDGPVDRLHGIDLDDVVLTECDDAFWRRLCGTRPSTLAEGLWQTHMASARTHESDWLFVVDSDEFLTGGSIRQMLSRVPEDIAALRVRNMEAVWDTEDDIGRPFGGRHFRKPLPSGLAALVTPLVYGRLAPFFTNGLVGHASGKHFVRRGADFTQIKSHNTWSGDRPLGRWAHKVVPGAEGMVVAHYDAVSFERWREKWRRRFSGEMRSITMSARRAAQMQRIEAAISAGDDRAMALFRRFYGLSGWQKAVLKALGGLETHDVFGKVPASDRVRASSGGNQADTPGWRQEQRSRTPVA